MDRLWSPWRFRYVSQALPTDDCIFCLKPAAQQDEENLIVHRGRTCFVLLNLFPYTTGHLMIAPYQHGASFSDFETATLHEMIELAAEAERHLRATYKPQGLNAGWNLGECAGAGIAGHLHLHVLPRWTGDANFMTTIGETRVMPEDLPTTWRKLTEAFAA